MYKIMLVEDDKTIVDVLCRQLAKWDYNIKAADAFDMVVEQFCEFSPHLVLMDISLPFFNGYHWCREIRKISKVPIVFISSASDNMSLVMAINMGADDFIAKPFDLDVITAKIGAILRRTYAFSGEQNLLIHGDIVLDLGNAAISYKDEKMELTKNEFKIMQLLLQSKGNVVSRDTIIRALWESESFIDDNTLTVNITRLRKKLESIGLAELIKTKKGIGYSI